MPEKLKQMKKKNKFKKKKKMFCKSMFNTWFDFKASKKFNDCLLVYKAK